MVTVRQIKKALPLYYMELLCKHEAMTEQIAEAGIVAPILFLGDESFSGGPFVFVDAPILVHYAGRDGERYRWMLSNSVATTVGFERSLQLLRSALDDFELDPEDDWQFMTADLTHFRLLDPDTLAREYESWRPDFASCVFTDLATLYVDDRGIRTWPRMLDAYRNTHDSFLVAAPATFYMLDPHFPRHTPAHAPDLVHHIVDFVGHSGYTARDLRAQIKAFHNDLHRFRRLFLSTVLTVPFEEPCDEDHK